MEKKIQKTVISTLHYLFIALFFRFWAHYSDIFSHIHSAVKLEKNAISKEQKNIIYIFKNGKK